MGKIIGEFIGRANEILEANKAALR